MSVYISLSRGMERWKTSRHSSLTYVERSARAEEAWASSERGCTESCTHRIIILIERACLHNRIGRNRCKFSDQNVQRHSVTSLETARSLANDPSGGRLRGNSPWNCNVSYLSLVYGSTCGVCGRNLTEGNVFFFRWKANMFPLFSIMTLLLHKLLDFRYSQYNERLSSENTKVNHEKVCCGLRVECTKEGDAGSAVRKYQKQI